MNNNTTSPPTPPASSLNVCVFIFCLCVAEARPLIHDTLPRHIHPSTLNSAALIFAGALPTHNRQHNYRIPLNVTARILRLSVANARRTTQLPPPCRTHHHWTSALAFLCLRVAKARPITQDTAPRIPHPSILNAAPPFCAGALPTHYRQDKTLVNTSHPSVPHSTRLNDVARILRTCCITFHQNGTAARPPTI